MLILLKKYFWMKALLSLTHSCTMCSNLILITYHCMHHAIMGCHDIYHNGQLGIIVKLGTQHNDNLHKHWVLHFHIVILIAIFTKGWYAECCGTNHGNVFESCTWSGAVQDLTFYKDFEILMCASFNEQGWDF